MERLLKEERLKHNNRLMIYTPLMNNRYCRERANNVKLERSENGIFTFFSRLCNVSASRTVTVLIKIHRPTTGIFHYIKLFLQLVEKQSNKFPNASP